MGSPWLQAGRLRLPGSEDRASAGLTSTSDIDIDIDNGIDNGRQQQLRAALDGHAFQAFEAPEAPLIEFLKRVSQVRSLPGAHG
jgi:hypothetical protein